MTSNAQLDELDQKLEGIIRVYIHNLTESETVMREFVAEVIASPDIAPETLERCCDVLALALTIHTVVRKSKVAR